MLVRSELNLISETAPEGRSRIAGMCFRSKNLSDPFVSCSSKHISSAAIRSLPRVSETTSCSFNLSSGWPLNSLSILCSKSRIDTPVDALSVSIEHTNAVTPFGGEHCSKEKLCFLIRFEVVFISSRQGPNEKSKVVFSCGLQASTLFLIFLEREIKKSSPNNPLTVLVAGLLVIQNRCDLLHAIRDLQHAGSLAKLFNQQAAYIKEISNYFWII